MAILAGGAMRIVDRKKRSATIADDCIGFLDLVWHGHTTAAKETIAKFVLGSRLRTIRQLANSSFTFARRDASVNS